MAEVIPVYDGNTFKARARIWPGFTWRGNIRTDDVDTPVIKVHVERKLAASAKETSREKISNQ